MADVEQIPLPERKYRKQKIPVAIREAVWVTRFGRVFEHKCSTSWCPNKLTVFDFQSGHNIPESKGGKTCVDNLYPLCARCNLSMGDRFTFDEWTAMKSPMHVSIPIPRPVQRSAQIQTEPRGFLRYFRCFYTTNVHK